MVFYPRGTAHTLEIPDGASATLLCAHISFEDGGANPLARALPTCLLPAAGGHARPAHTLELLFAEAAAKAQGREVILDRLCDVLMIQVLRHEFETGTLSVGLLAGLPTASWRRHWVRSTRGRTNPGSSNRWPAKPACRAPAFTEHFRNVVGVPPGEYLTRWRIGVAQDLLARGCR